MKKTLSRVLAMLTILSMIAAFPVSAVTYVPLIVTGPAVQVHYQHTFTDWTKVDDMYHLGTCSCGQTLKQPHSWNAGVVTTQATATAAGTKTYTCVYCHATKTASYSLVALQPVRAFSTALNGSLTWQEVPHAGSYRVSFTYTDADKKSVTKTVETSLPYIDLSQYLAVGTPVAVVVTALPIKGTDYTESPASATVNTTVRTVNWPVVATLISMRTFNVTVTAGEGGKVSPNGTVAVRWGQSVFFEITADSGYEIADVLVDGKSVGAVAKLTLTRVYEEHKIEARFNKTKKAATAADADADYLYASAVAFAKKNELFTGAGKDKFGVDETVTRAEFITALGKLVGMKTADYKGKASCTDVKDSDAFAPYVTWAVENELVTAADKLFRPNDKITREEAVVILARYAARLGRNTASKFSLSAYKDAKDVSAAALSAMQWAVGSGFLPVSGKNLAPKTAATRGELAQLLYSFCLTFK